MYKKEVLITNIETNEQHTFQSISLAGMFLSVCNRTINLRANDGKPVKGYRIKIIEEENEIVPKKPVQSFNGSCYRHKEKITDNDRDKYTILPYEVIYKHICVTPCPYSEEEKKPLIGSSTCANCSRFRGRDKSTHEVACSFKFYAKHQH